MAIVLTDANFDSEIAKNDKMSLVDFYATWCEPCSMMAPILEKLAEEFSDKIVLMKANIDETPVNSGKYQVDVIPTVVLFKNGNPVGTFTGFNPEPRAREILTQMLNDNA